MLKVRGNLHSLHITGISNINYSHSMGITYSFVEVKVLPIVSTGSACNVYRFYIQCQYYNSFILLLFWVSLKDFQVAQSIKLMIQRSTDRNGPSPSLSFAICISNGFQIQQSMPIVFRITMSFLQVIHIIGTALRNYSQNCHCTRVTQVMTVISIGIFTTVQQYFKSCEHVLVKLCFNEPKRRVQTDISF